MFARLKALIMAIYLLIAAIPYGNAPIQVEFDCTMKDGIYEYAPGDWGSVSIECKNVGKPFKGETPYSPSVSIYKIENGEKQYLPCIGIALPAEPEDIIIKNGDEFVLGDDFKVLEDAESGTYSMEVTVYGCTKVYEDVIIIK